MDPNLTFQKILDKIKADISGPNFRTWFSQASLGKITDEKLIIIVPSAFVKGQLINRYEALILEAVQKVIGKQLTIEYSIDPSKLTKGEDSEEEEVFELSSQSSLPTPQNNLNPKYNLENFVVGLTNNLAYAAAQAVVQNPGISYNPLFIYGPSGVGKTHLMQGIGNTLLRKNPYAKLIFISSERFMNDFVDSIQMKKMGEFRNKYRTCDIILIDDIQFISGKDSLQEEFFHTFNELHTRNSQLIFTSDRPPNEIQKLESRLSSRFQGGLMVDIQLPDFDTRMAILKAKLSERNESFPEDALRLIAETITSNTRELEGKLIQILQTIKLTNQAPDLETVRKILGKTPPSNPDLPKDPKKILDIITRYFNVPLTDITGPRRQKGLVLPRQIAMFILYEDGKIPLEKIGQLLGGRDHTTVMHGVEKIREISGRDSETQRLLLEVRQSLI